MTNGQIRKEVWIGADSLQPLQKEADRRNWSLKKYMEWLVKREADKLFNSQSNKPNKK